MRKPSATHPINLDVSVVDKTLHMELDPGAAVSIIYEKTHKKLFEDLPLQKSPIALKTYTGESMAVRGKRIVQVRYGSQEHTIPLTVVAGNGPTLLGRDCKAFSTATELEDNWSNSFRPRQGQVTGDCPAV